MYPNEDRSWMYNRQDECGYLNGTFVDGIRRFIAFALSQTHLLDRGNAKCPCARCGNSKYFKAEDIQLHLCKWGFVPQYYVWAAHGEMNNNYMPPITDIGESSSSHRDSEDHYRHMVDDVFGGQFENETFNQMGDEEPNSEAKDFFELLRAAEVPVYVGRETTVLEWVSTFLANKIECNTTDEACDRFLKQLHQTLSPRDQTIMPNSLYNMKKMMKRLGLGYKTYDVCVNNCMLYYGEFEGKGHTSCQYCNEGRYEESQNSNSRNPISRKKLWYFPVTPRLQRLYMSRYTAEHMTWHLKCQGGSDQMIHPASGDAWKYFDEKHKDFASEARNVRLGLCTDGFCPNGPSATPYSVWPVFVTPYNLPPDLCMRQEYIFLSLIISGPKSPGKNIDVLLRPLIDELKELWVSGTITYDSFRKQNFVMRASLLWTISDFPAYGMLSQWSTHGRLSCPYCMEETKAFQLKYGRKTTFFDCHRRFLPMNHQWRKNTTDFIYGRIEDDEPLHRRLGEEMLEHVERIPNMPFGLSKHYLQDFGETHNWCRRSIFWELPYWKTNLIRHNLDVMHCEKNFFDNIKNTVMDDPDKTKDNVNARKDLELLTRRSELFLQLGANGQQYKRKAVYCLSRDQKRLVCEWLCGLRFPDGYASKISRCVQMPQCRLANMKSHDCHVFMQRLLPIAFRDFLPDHVWGPLVEISNFFRSLCATELSKSNMEVLERSIVETMCKLEKIFPPSFFDSMEHLAIHLPWEAKVGGPVQYRWMYPFERRMLYLKRMANNKARIEGSICEANIISEIANFVSLYFNNGEETRGSRLNRNETSLGLEVEGQVSVFQKKGRALTSRSKTRYLTGVEYKAAEMYVLLNCPEVDPWIRLFDLEVPSNPNDPDNQKTRNNLFVQWFKGIVMSGRYATTPDLRALAQGPLMLVKLHSGYIVNGFRFHTEAYGSGRTTMNSGVCVKAIIGEPSETNFYGMLQEVIELEYWGSGQLQSIVLFKCIWYDIYNGMSIHDPYRLIDINPRLRLSTGVDEPFILASQAQQVYYTVYPSSEVIRRRRGWWAVCTTRARHIVDTSSIATTSTDRARSTTQIYQESGSVVLRVENDLSLYNSLQLGDDEFVPVLGDDIDEEDNESEASGEEAAEDDSDSDYV